ncbi:MAG: leucine-rich repeat protein [Prevotella copri]|nr:leucine-rich repeat protein [Segatella copri]
MSLENQVSRVSKGTKDTLKTLINKLGGNVTDELIDQYPSIASALDDVEPAGSAQQALIDAKIYTDQKILEVPTPDVSGQIGTHNADASAHADIRSSISNHTSDTDIHVTAEEKSAWNAKADAPFKPAGKSYLIFSSPNSFTLGVGDATKHWDGTLEYFASDKTWTTWDGTTILSSVDNDGEHVLYLRGTGNTKMGCFDESMEEPAPWVINGTNVRCNGNIETLLDYATVEAGQHPTMAEACFAALFFGCTALIKAPALPATTLANYCYSSMFFGCTALIKAPALPATTLATYCYPSMFQGCTSLTQAPALPATTLATGCYSYMFDGCKGLTRAPALPATTLATGCYSYMFDGCKGLTQAPALPATTLADRCYRSMFQGCTSLKLSTTQTDEYTQEYRIPSSGTGTTAINALNDMFTRTGGTFTGTPEINTTYYLSSDNMVVYDTEVATLREYVGSMIDASNGDTPFKPAGKSYLTFSSPNSFTLSVNDATKHWKGTLEYFSSNKTWTSWDGTTTLSSVDNDGEYVLYLRGTGNTVITGNNENYKWVLTGSDIKCIGNIENLLDYATVESGNHPTIANYCYQSMFSGCISLTQAPALPATTLADYCYQSMFYGCTSLTQAPALPATTLKSYCYHSMFQGCTSLTQAPALPATTLTYGCYSVMFYGCTSLTQAPALPATTLEEYCYQSMFYGCTSLTQAPALPATTLKSNCYIYMFQGCTSLIQAPTLSATTLTDHCYASMFRDCTSLTQAPALPATTLATSCYASMFRDCTSLTQAPALPATTLAPYCYYYMFYGCKKIKLSTTHTGEYTQEYRIPSSGTGITATDAFTYMFNRTGGTFTGTPSIDTTYYLSSDNMVVRETEVATLNGYVSSMIDVVHSYGIEDLEAGTSPLETGKLYFVYE